MSDRSYTIVTVLPHGTSARSRGLASVAPGLQFRFTFSSPPCSIGSLGDNSSFGFVSNVLVEDVILQDVTNGMRIKTYQGGYGAVRNITFRNIALLNAKAALVIDQVSEHKQCRQPGHSLELPGSPAQPAGRSSLLTQCLELLAWEPVLFLFSPRVNSPACQRDCKAHLACVEVT